MTSFKLTIDQLAYIISYIRNCFEPDNIRHGDSIEALKGFGKIEGLENALHTNYRVTLCYFRKEYTKTPRTTKLESRPTETISPLSNHQKLSWNL